MHTEPFVGLQNQSQALQTTAILRSCVHCGLCNATCPTYTLNSDEREGPRGRIYAIKHVLEGGKATANTLAALDRCLSCRSCESTCPSGVKYHELLETGREVMVQQLSRPYFERWKRQALCAVLPYRQRFAVALWLATWFAPLLPAHLRPPPRQAKKTTVPIPTQPRKMLLLAGCVQPTLAPNINEAAKQVFSRLGIELLEVPEAGCCGAVSYHLSAREQALALMRRNIDVWLPYLQEGVEAIVMTASGCGLMVKEYAEALQEDAEYAPKARLIVAATRDIVEILGQEDLSKLQLNATGKIAFQSPCTLQHGQQLGGTVETLLLNLGFDLTPVANAHLCCGSAGTYSLFQPKIAQALLDNKLQTLESAVPEQIVSANIGCICQLSTQAKVPVSHWIELIAQAMADEQQA